MIRCDISAGWRGECRGTVTLVMRRMQVFTAHCLEPAVFPDLQRGHLMPLMSDRDQCRLE